MYEEILYISLFFLFTYSSIFINNSSLRSHNLISTHFHLPSYFLFPSISRSHIRFHSTHIQAIPMYEPYQNQWRDHFHPRVLFHPFPPLPGLHHPLVAHSTIERIHLRSRAVTFLRLTQPFCSSAA